MTTSNVRTAFFVLALAACGDNLGANQGPDGGGSNHADAASADAAMPDAQATIPTVIATLPANVATDVALNASVSAMFSEEMDRTTLTGTTFTLVKAGTVIAIPATVTYGHSRVELLPAAHLASGSTFTAMITTGAKSAHGQALAASYMWTFTTGTTIAPDAPVDLGSAGDFVMLAKSGISTVPTSKVTGNIGVSPINAAAITGFSLIADSTNVFSRSTQVTGKVYAANYAAPTPTNLTVAVGDLQTAFTAAAGRPADVIALGAGTIGGLTLAPGVYKWSTGVSIPTDVTLTGSSTDIWVFQIAQDLTVASGAKTLLTGGAVAEHVFWQISGKATLDTTSHVEGIVMSQTSIALKTGASVHGRMFAQTAISIDGSTVANP